MQNVVEIKDLERRFGRHRALRRVSLDLPPGVVLGLVGQNGAGKTTLLRHVLGLLRAQHGSVRVFGLDPVQRPEQVLARIGYVSEQRNLPAWMRIGELLRYTQAFYPQWDETLATDLCRRFALDVDQRVGGLSRGQHVRAALVLALSHRPELLVLDEPSSGLDPRVRKDILEAIVRIVAEEGRSVLFSSHLLDEVERMADHLALIEEGRIVLTGEMVGVRSDHCQATIRLDGPADVLDAVPEVIAWHNGGREVRLLCRGDAEQVRVALARLGAEVVEMKGASLDEIFQAHTGRRPVAALRERAA